MSPRILRELTTRQRAAAKSLTPADRDALTEWCAFLQYIDRAVAEASTAGGTVFIERMGELQKLPSRIAAGDAQSGFPALAAAVARLEIPASLLRECIDGASLDLVRAQHRDRAQLDQFHFKIAGVPMLVASRIAGVSEPESRPSMEQLGALAQEIAHLPAVAEDLARGRIYITLEAMNAAGVSREDLAGGRMNTALIALAEVLAADVTTRLAKLEGSIADIAHETGRDFANASLHDARESLERWTANGRDFFAPPAATTLGARLRSAFNLGRSAKK